MNDISYMFLIPKDVLNLIVAKLDLSSILALKTTCKHLYFTLLKYKASDKDDKTITVLDFINDLKRYHTLDINKNMCDSIIAKLENQPLHLFCLDNFQYLNCQRISFSPVYEVNLHYLQVRVDIINENGMEEDFEAVYEYFQDMEIRLNNIVRCSDDFDKSYIYDCFSSKLLEKFSESGIILEIEDCSLGSDT